MESFFERIGSFVDIALIALLIFFLLNAPGIFADSLMLSDGKEVKGLIVDEYTDRVIVSTFEGEKAFLRRDVKSVEYEDAETRLLKLGDDACRRGKYKPAAYYYQAALRLNPDSIQARDGGISAIRKELSSGAEIAKEEIELMMALEKPALGAGNDALYPYEKNVEEMLGLKIKKEKKREACYVDSVFPFSASANRGIMKNDVISAIWNENIRYMPYKEMIKKLSGPEFSMVKLSIEREVIFSDPKKVKLDIGLQEDGYFIKDISGAPLDSKHPTGFMEVDLVKPGDWLLEINSVSTRYMRRDELYGLLSGGPAPLTILIKRDLYIIREKGGNSWKDEL